MEPCNYDVIGIGGSTQPVRKAAWLRFQLEGDETNHWFTFRFLVVTESLPHPFLLGRDFGKQFAAALSFKYNRITWEDHPVKAGIQTAVEQIEELWDEPDAHLVADNAVQVDRRMVIPAGQAKQVLGKNETLHALAATQLGENTRVEIARKISLLGALPTREVTQPLNE
jgi:hypothetical protein